MRKLERVRQAGGVKLVRAGGLLDGLGGTLGGEIEGAEMVMRTGKMIVKRERLCEGGFGFGEVRLLCLHRAERIDQRSVLRRGADRVLQQGLGCEAVGGLAVDRGERKRPLGRERLIERGIELAKRGKAFRRGLILLLQRLCDGEVQERRRVIWLERKCVAKFTGCRRVLTLGEEYGSQRAVSGGDLRGEANGRFKCGACSLQIPLLEFVRASTKGHRCALGNTGRRGGLC